MSRIWIDLTDLAVWSGHLTGIQRVVYEIAKRYHNDPAGNVGYFVFDAKTREFYDFDFATLNSQIERAAIMQEELNPVEPHPLKVAVLRAYHNSPESVKRFFTEKRRKQIKRVYKKGRSLAKRPMLAAKQAPENRTPISLVAGDVVLVMGKPWDDLRFIETIAEKKQQVGIRVVQVLYDMIPVFFPHLFGRPLFEPYTKHMFDTAVYSDLLLSISESSKRDFLAFCDRLNLPKPKVEVIRLGDDFSKVEPKKPGIGNLEPNEFILCVGTMEVRKNHQILYLAYKEALQRGIEIPKLVIVGGKGWYTSDLLYAIDTDPDMKDRIFYGSRSDQELEWLYENCRFTIYPSVYEGWGLPVAESLARGKVCVSSGVSSMPEIAGDVIDYFSPYDSGDCLDKIIKYLDDDVLAKKQAQINKKYQLHSWTQTYEQVHDIIKNHI